MERSVVAITPTPFNDIPPPSYPARIPPRSALKDVSFSPSYLRPDPPGATAAAAFAQPPSSRGLPRRMVVTADDAELSIFDAEKYFNETSEQKQLPTSLERIADKYEFDRASSVSSSVDGYGRSYRNGSHHATPTASSEASWNSQSGLLTNPPGTIAVSMRKGLHLDDGGKKGPCSPRRWLFRRKCPCTGNKSVDVKEKFSQSRNQNAHTHHTHNNSNSELIKVISADHHHHKKLETEEDGPTMAKMRVSAQSWAKDEQLSCSNRSCFTTSELGRKVAYSARPFLSDARGFTFPVITPPSSTLADSAMRAPVNSPEDPPRVSLEVFRPSLQLDDEEVTLSRREASQAYPGDVGRRSFSFAASPRRRGEDDVASDSSSDLFELESFSTSTGTGTGGGSAAIYRRRDSLDELVRYGGGPPSYRRSLDETSTTVTSADLAAAEAYEPSEASVEWSVVTADAFDRTSLANFSASASEFGEQVRFAVQEEGLEGGGGGKKKGAGGGLLNCRCEKAVSVGPHPVRSAYQSQVMESSGARVGAAVMARVAAANIGGGGGGGAGGGGLIHHVVRPPFVASNLNSSFSSARAPPRAFLHR